jgi:hypothetical protein
MYLLVGTYHGMHWLSCRVARKDLEESIETLTCQLEELGAIRKKELGDYQRTLEDLQVLILIFSAQSSTERLMCNTIRM